MTSSKIQQLTFHLARESRATSMCVEFMQCQEDFNDPANGERARVRVQMKNRPQSEHKFSGSKKKAFGNFLLLSNINL